MIECVIPDGLRINNQSPLTLLHAPLVKAFTLSTTDGTWNSLKDISQSVLMNPTDRIYAHWKTRRT